MALIKCHECGAQVSTEAKACPSCGAAPKVPQSKIVTFGGGFIAVVVLLGVVGSCVKPDAPPKPSGPSAGVAAPAPAEPQRKACAEDDLRCRGEEGVIAAGIYCRRAVESLAKHSMRWTDGFLESKFDRFRWKKEPGGTITYIGNKAEFQNGFGAFTPVIYECDLGADNKTVVDVRAREGRLAR